MLRETPTAPRACRFRPVLRVIGAALALAGVVADPLIAQVDPAAADGETQDQGSAAAPFVIGSAVGTYHGAFQIFSDQLAPKSWRTAVNGLEVVFGGPLVRSLDLGFFATLSVEARKYEPLYDGFNDVPILLPSGIATQADGSPAVFRLPRENLRGYIDSVDVAFPDYVEWDNGPNQPFNPSDRYSALGKLAWTVGGGSSLALSYRRERYQRIYLGLSELYNPDGYEGSRSATDAVTFGGHFPVTETPSRRISVDLKASYRRYLDEYGIVDPKWRVGHIDPWLGFNFSSLRFVTERTDWPVTETLVRATRCGAIPYDWLQVFPGRFDLRTRYSSAGLMERLRLNPYGVFHNFPVGGFGDRALEYLDDREWALSGRLDMQLTPRHRVRLDGEYAHVEFKRIDVPLYSSLPSPLRAETPRAALTLSDRLDLGLIVLDGALRWDYYDSDIEYPRVPGFVANVPDSLRADFVTVEEGEGPILERVVPLEDCGGEATRLRRINPETGEAVCKPNFIPAEAKSAFSPRLAAVLPLAPKSTAWVSYERDVLVPGPRGLAFRDLEAAATRTTMFANVYADLIAGRASSRTPFARDVDLPRTDRIQLGYRQLVGDWLWLEVVGYLTTLRDGLEFRLLEYEDPNQPSATGYLVSLVNADQLTSRGIDLAVSGRLGDFAELSAAYSYLDGHDPEDYTRLFLRGDTLASVVSGDLIIPQDFTPPLEERERHTIDAALTVKFPPGYRAGTTLGSLLSDFGLLAAYRSASGYPYTRLRSSADGFVGPPQVFGSPSEPPGALSLPDEKYFDVRLTKGIAIRGGRLRVFLDWQNPLGLSNTAQVYLETGTLENDLFRTRLLSWQMRDPFLDGDTDIDDFDIAAESPENPVNVFSLLEAERRFGNGDGVFTVDEQRAAFGAWYDLFYGPERYRYSNRRLRLGVELVF